MAKNNARFETELECKGLTRKRILLVVSLIVFITAASVVGQQILASVPGFYQPTLIAFAGLALLLLGAISAHPDRRIGSVGLLLSIALIALLLYQAGLLRLAELMHVVCFGALGLALAPARPATAVAILATVSVGDEALQALLPYRVGSLPDVGMNFASGILLYVGWRLLGRVE